jgi:hypothetical protein
MEKSWIGGCNLLRMSWAYIISHLVSKIIPVEKKSEPFELGDYRPISILPVLSKAMVIRDQTVFFVKSHNLLDPFQSGFRANHSTASALLKVAGDIQMSCDHRLLTILLLLDFFKAFDNLIHFLLLSKVMIIFQIPGFRSSSPEVFFKRYISVCLCRCCDFKATATYWGLVQGSVLEPLLFYWRHRFSDLKLEIPHLRWWCTTLCGGSTRWAGGLRRLYEHGSGSNLY